MNYLGLAILTADDFNAGLRLMGLRLGGRIALVVVAVVVHVVLVVVVVLVVPVRHVLRSNDV
jgi:uncharacterized membrane protein